MGQTSSVKPGRWKLERGRLGFGAAVRSAAEELDVIALAEPEVNRSRQDYLHRLGIQKDGNTSSFSSGPLHKDSWVDETWIVKESEEFNENCSFKTSMLDLKSQDEFRVNFLRKLSYEKVWVPPVQRPPTHQTVLIFDWDDTLLCTSFLNVRGEQPMSVAVTRCLQLIQEVVIRLLELAQRLGHTFIITNAMSGWVEYSAAKWCPQLLPVLQKVPVISARSNHERQFPGEVNKWKISAFLEVQKQLDSQIITNLISLGDSNFEMEAVHVMGKEFAQAMIKTVKFREHPSPEELLKQLQLVEEKLERIVENAKNLKIGLERKAVGNA